MTAADNLLKEAYTVLGALLDNASRATPMTKRGDDLRASIARYSALIDEDSTAVEPEFETSERGFRHLAPIRTSYGHDIRIYESSAASQPSIWLQMAQGNDQVAMAAHLHLDQAKAIRDQLDWLIRNHYQVREDQL